MYYNNIAGYDYVFIKEMVEHFTHRHDYTSYVPEDCIHTFLIRHPIKILNSALESNKKTNYFYYPGRNVN